MSPLTPVPTACEPRLRKLDGVRTVIFDIYGTLVISAAGDISLASDEESLRGMQEALEILGGEAGRRQAEDALLLYRETVREGQEKRKEEGVEFPEIEIREVWRTIASALGLKATRIETAALAYECLVNPCWEMPGASKMVRQLVRNRISLGIVSNAQFYTRAVVEGLCDFHPGSEFFEPDLCVYSFEEREGKPSPALFRKVAAAARKRGLEPGKILYVGNDFAKDIAPAREVGFRTALFAGDARSLRSGGLEIEEACSLADVVLTELAQLEEVLELSE